MLYKVNLVNSPAQRVSFEPAEPPCPSHLVVPAHLVERPRDRDHDSDTERVFFGGIFKATSGDGLVLLQFLDLRRMGERHRPAPALEWTGVLTHFVCNQISGQLFRLPDIEGTKRTAPCSETGILTQSKRPHQPPARYAVAALVGDRTLRFDMRRFFSETGEWDTLVGLPSPFPLARQMQCKDHEVVAFAGRLWWVDVSCGAISADPFSDRPDLHFVELPRGRVMTEQQERLRVLGRYRRIGVSEGRLRYAEVTQEEPLFLSSFVLDNDGSSWTLEHRVALRVDGVHSWQGHRPRIGVVDPMNSGVIHITIGYNALAVDMDKEKVLGCSTLDVSDDMDREKVLGSKESYALSFLGGDALELVVQSEQGMR
ncbi:hypothetical protein EJB05_35923, partial [Eragrostis curvula]